MAPLLELDGLTRRVDGRAIVDGVDLAVDGGQVHALMGPSGAGKTTLLRLVVLLDPPTSGRALVDGVDHRSLEPVELRRRVGWVAQQPAFEPGTVWENATVGPRRTGHGLDEAAIGELLERVELDARADLDVEELSGGERQRLGLVRTLAVGPEVLLLDEPTANLDRALEATVEGLLAEQARDGRGILLVTHAPEQAERVAEASWWMEEGRLARASPQAGGSA